MARDKFIDGYKIIRELGNEESLYDHEVNNFLNLISLKKVIVVKPCCIH